MNFGDAMEAVAHGEGAAQVGIVANAAAEGAVGPWSEAFREVFGIHNIRSFGGMLNYMTSRWAFACFSVVRSSNLSHKWKHCQSLTDNDARL